MRGLAILLLTACVLTGPVAVAQDMRAASRRAEQDRRAAEEARRAAEERILEDREALLAEVNRLEGKEKALVEALDLLQMRFKGLNEKEKALSKTWAQRELAFREFVGTARTSARDLETTLKHSPFSVGSPERLARIQPLLGKNYFPGIDDIRVMTDLLFGEIERSGEVWLKKGTFVDRTGSDREGRVLTLGKFTTLYDTGDEVGFLRYSEEGGRFYALSALPSWGVRRSLKSYMEGRGDAVYMDLSGGGALRQITHRPTLWEQIQGGGPIVWPILVIALFVLILVLERGVSLKRVHGNTDRIMDEMNALAYRGDWKACESLIEKYEGKGWPVISVLAAGLSGRHEDRETQENILEEAILREVPRLERFLSILAILGAVAPLLGLLGTVTGMIDTFRVITLYGTGDPRMMSGGISEALITTELGLAVAIPTMILHTFLSRRVDHIVNDMEEKAVALANITQKERRQGGSAGERG
jgi:biopolymer transport protein ExbB